MIFNLIPGADNAYKDLAAQAKTYLPVSTTFNGYTLVGFLNKAIQKYIHQTIGREFYNEVNANTANYPTELVDMIRRSVFNFAFSSYAAIANLQISNVGFTEASTSTQAPARLEAINKFQNEVFDTGMRELDEILYFIETQLVIVLEAPKYGLFVASVQYDDLQKNIIKTAREFNRFYPINESRLVFYNLIQDLNFVDKLMIKPLLHDTLYAVVEAGVTPASKVLLEQFIKPALANLSIARSVNKLTAILGLYGTITIFDNTANNYARTHKTAPMDLLDAYRAEAEKKGQRYLSEMIGYIAVNAALYPEYPHAVPVDFLEDDFHDTSHEHTRIFVGF